MHLGVALTGLPVTGAYGFGVVRRAYDPLGRKPQGEVPGAILGAVQSASTIAATSATEANDTINCTTPCREKKEVTIRPNVDILNDLSLAHQALETWADGFAKD